MHPKGKDDRLCIRLSTAEKARLEALAKARGVKMSALARDLLAHALVLEGEAEGDLRPLMRWLRGAP